MSFQSRYYQLDAAEQTAKDAIAGHNPVAALPTGAGKSIVLCQVAEKLIDNDPTCHILVLSHVKEILEQNHASLERYFEGIEIGLYSAGLKSRTVRKITVAGIGSVQNKTEDFEHFDYVIIDECHRVSFEKKTGYRKFIDEIYGPVVIGLTATPYRTKGGYIYEGDEALFDKLSVDYTHMDKFNGLVEEGYLSEIFTKRTMLMMDTTGIKTTGGDFNSKQLDEELNRENITQAAIMETVHFGKNYKHWLCFAISIDHAEDIKKKFDQHGISACVVHSKMTEDREKTIADFKSGKYRVLVNVDVLTTGFDFPNIDLIVMLRPTKSPILHVQTAGRGLRVVYAQGYDLQTTEGRLEAIQQGGKPHCLVLDFAGNTKRLGPINDPLISKKKKGKGDGKPLTKDCPECDFINHGAARSCCNCGHEFKFEEKITMEASSVELVKKKEKKKEKVYIAPSWVLVNKIDYEAGESKKAGKFMRVNYHSGITVYSEVVCIEGKGFAKHSAKNWIKHRWTSQHESPPETTAELLSNLNNLLVPKRVLVDTNGKYPSIKNSEF